MFAYTLTMMEIKLDYYFKFKSPWFIIVLLIIFVVYCFQPCVKCGYRRARGELLITLKEIVISPFGRVRFRDFFFADVLTSITGTLGDIGFALYFCIYDTAQYESLDDKQLGYIPYMAHRRLYVYLIVIGFLPYWFRFWQCVNKYYYTRMKVQLWNTGKYFSKLIPPLITAIYPRSNTATGNGFVYYAIFMTIATTYCSIWDFYMDWGLFRRTK
jgi:hypothetical protein